MNKMYNFNQYLLTKYNNSVLDRYENMCNALQSMLGMPVMIAGLHTGFKNVISQVERQLANINPRCVLTTSGVSIDRNACTAIQTMAPMQSVNDQGQFGNNVLQYRRLPMTSSFNCTIVMSDAALALRMAEYIGMLAFSFPVIAGDEHTKTTLIPHESTSIEFDSDKNEYRLSFSIDANMQILEPMKLAYDDTAYPLVGVGVLMPDGTWNETAMGDLIVDENGNPILDENGEPQYGKFVEDGWYRLHVRYHVHAHKRWDECMESEVAVNHEIPSGAERKGDIEPVAVPKFDIRTNNVIKTD